LGFLLLGLSRIDLPLWKTAVDAATRERIAAKAGAGKPFVTSGALEKTEAK